MQIVTADIISSEEYLWMPQFRLKMCGEMISECLYDSLTS
jgi:hypothetical protein